MSKIPGPLQIDPLAAATAVDRHPAAGVHTEEARFIAGRLTVGAPEPARMKMVLQPGNTLVVIEEVNDGKIHTRDCTNVALLV